MRKISLALAFVASLLALPAAAANFSAKDAAAATIIFTNPGNCTTGCTPIFAWSDSTGANLVAVLTAGADGASNTANGGLTYGRNLVFNGTTWDRWTGAVAATLSAETTKVIGTVRAAAGGFADGSNVTIGAQADAACGTATGTCTLQALIKFLNTAATAATPAGTNLIGDVNVRQGGTALSAANPLPVAGNPYPVGAVPYTATATGTTAATTATLAGAASVTTYICGFSIRANATAAATGNATVTGVITATLNFTQWTAPNASGLGVTEMIFSPCVPASAANTSVAVVSAAPGTGGVVSVTAWGYKL